MNANGSIIQTPFHSAHSHFYDYIPDFPGLPVGDNYEQKHKAIMKKLRYQLLTDNTNWEEKACFRNCFKLNHKKYVEFCLEKKCGGVEFMKAADSLGYVKKEVATAEKKNPDLLFLRPRTSFTKPISNELREQLIKELSAHPMKPV